MCTYKYTHAPVYTLYAYTNAVQARRGKINTCRYSKLTSRQLSVLEAAFANSSYLIQSKVLQVMKQTGIERKKILSWFRSRIYKAREGKKEGACEYNVFLTYVCIYAPINLSFSLLLCVAFFSPCVACSHASLLPIILAHLPSSLTDCLYIGLTHWSKGLK